MLQVIKIGKNRFTLLASRLPCVCSIRLFCFRYRWMLVGTVWTQSYLRGRRQPIRLSLSWRLRGYCLYRLAVHYVTYTASSATIFRLIICRNASVYDVIGCLINSTDVNECASSSTNDCVHGSCVNVPGTYTCDCEPGHNGPLCDKGFYTIDGSISFCLR